MLKASQLSNSEIENGHHPSPCHSSCYKAACALKKSVFSANRTTVGEWQCLTGVACDVFVLQVSPL